MTSSTLTRDQRAVLDNLFVTCGTPEGWRLHLYRREIACRDCAWAWDISPGCAPVTRNGCGTADGWTGHRRRYEWPCPPCAAAREVFERERCGTYAGWMWHRHSGTQVCPGCLAAALAYARARKDNPTRRLLRARDAGAGLVDVTSRPVVHAPRRVNDSWPFALAGDAAVRLPARNVRAAYRSESEGT